MRGVWSFLWSIPCFSHLKERRLWHLPWELGMRAGAKCTNPLRSQHSWTLQPTGVHPVPRRIWQTGASSSALTRSLGRIFPPPLPWTRHLGLAMQFHWMEHPVCCFLPEMLWSLLQLGFSNLLDFLHWCLSWRGPRAKAWKLLWTVLLRNVVGWPTGPQYLV